MPKFICRKGRHNVLYYNNCSAAATICRYYTEMFAEAKWVLELAEHQSGVNNKEESTTWQRREDHQWLG